MFEEIESRMNLHQIISFFLHGEGTEPKENLNEAFSVSERQIDALLQKYLPEAEAIKLGEDLFEHIACCENLVFEFGVKAGLRLSSIISGH